MDDHQKLTPISDLGEFGLIDRLSKDIELKNSSTVKGIGDDAAVLDYNKKQIVVTTDMLVEGIHFDLSYSPLKHLGYKAVVVNISDVLAMNAKPKQITVSIAVSARTSVESLDELYAGIKEACKVYNVDLVGGDTSSSRSGLIISITAIGEADKENVVYRKGAQENDLICVTGDLGAAYMGLQLLMREKEVYKVNPDSQPDLSGYEHVLEKQLKPEAPADIIDKLAKMKVKPTAMIDISDGLSSDIIHICKASDVGCVLHEDKLPIDNSTRRFGQEIEVHGTIAALNGGEDYELLFTVSMSDYETIKRYPEISVIGHITNKDKGYSLVTGDGNYLPLEAQGFNHAEE